MLKKTEKYVHFTGFFVFEVLSTTIKLKVVVLE